MKIPLVQTTVGIEDARPNHDQVNDAGHGLVLLCKMIKPYLPQMLQEQVVQSIIIAEIQNQSIQ